MRPVLTRIVGLLLLATGRVMAQAPEADTLAALESASRQKTAEWEKLAQDMEPSVARMLPCDPKAAATITAASQASEARLAAITAYLKGAEQQASQETAVATRVFTSAQSFAAELVTEKNEAIKEEAGIDAQIANLAESVKSRAALGDALKILQLIQMLSEVRSGLASGVTESQDAFLGPARDLIAALEAREAVLKELDAAQEDEHARWSAYYTARLGRAQTECSILRGPVAPSRGKQK